MSLKVAVASNKGAVKKKNQDSSIVMVGNGSRGEEVLLAAVCDGMGGLSFGELASRTMTAALKKWFANEYPVLRDDIQIEDSITEMIQNVNDELVRYGKERNKQCGTTAVIALIRNETNYLIVNIGDSRAYKFGSRTIRLTKDQTFVQREIDAGRMTYEQAAKDARRSILLQCIGVNEDVVPVFTYGKKQKNEAILLCSDGFRHKLTEAEMAEMFTDEVFANEKTMRDLCEQCIQLNISRGERDNITAILIR